MTHTHLFAPVRDGRADWTTATTVTGPVSLRQAAILRFVADHTVVHGYPPTLDEIAAAVGVGHASTAAYHVVELERMGLLARPERRHQRRSLRVVGGAA